MNWDRARGLFQLSRRHRAAGLPRLVGEQSPDPDGLAEPCAPLGAAATPHDGVPGFTSVRASSICVASGKGGTGKSVLTASLAHLLAARGRALVVDADLGVGNAHILQGLTPAHTLADVVEGLPARDALESCGPQVDLLAGGSGFSHLAGLDRRGLTRIAAGIAELEQQYRYVLVDSAAGLSPQTVTFAAGCDLVLLVTTPVLTALTDAYAFLKVLQAGNPGARASLVVNRATDRDEAHAAAARVCSVAERFLGHAPRYLGWLPDDPAVRESANHRCPVIVESPDAPVSQALRRLAARLLEETSAVHARGLGRTLRAEDARPRGAASGAAGRVG